MDDMRAVVVKMAMMTMMMMVPMVVMLMMKMMMMIVKYCCFFILKTYSQISNRGRSQKIPNLNFLHLFIALTLQTHFPKGIIVHQRFMPPRTIFKEGCLNEQY